MVDEWRALVQTMEAKTKMDQEMEKYQKKNQQQAYLSQLDEVKGVRQSEKRMSELERKI